MKKQSVIQINQINCESRPALGSVTQNSDFELNT